MTSCGRKIGPYDCCSIVTGDAKELAPAIPDEGVDPIFTDPPWDDKSMPLYELLAVQSARILRTGGFVIAYTGNDWLPQIMGYFGRVGLDWYRMFAGVQLNSDDRYFRKKLFVKWRPIIAYSKGASSPVGWVPDAAHTERDKTYHQWGQGIEPAAKYIGRMMPQDGLMVDLFTGGGTFPAVCKMLGRHYLAFEIDPEVAERARERVRNTQPPLFVMEPEQAQMEL